MSSSQSDLWSRFTHDPRDPGSASLRASDKDRDVVAEVLGEAYGDGRLDHEEFDTRSGAVSEVKLLGDLPPLVADLVPRDGELTPTPAKPADLQMQAADAWRRDLRNAVAGWAGPSVLTTGIWGVTAFANGDLYFFWPVFVIFGTGVRLVRTWFGKQDIIERKRERLERREVERRRRRQDRGGEHG